ncbi:MAG: helix-turn-helix domain-containing protein [Candidatus Gallimonas sp.]
MTKHILQKKMYYAAQLLREGMPASEVAFKCGYDNYSSFYKVFLRIIGTPPSKSL